MADEAPQFELAEAPKKRPFLGANARDGKGKALFPEVGSKMQLHCVAIESFVKDGEPQPALILKDVAGTEYIRVIGKTNQYQLSEFGLKTVNDAVGNYLTFRSYDTGSSGAFQYGLEIVHISDKISK